MLYNRVQCDDRRKPESGFICAVQTVKPLIHQQLNSALNVAGVSVSVQIAVPSTCRQQNTVSNVALPCYQKRLTSILSNCCRRLMVTHVHFLPSCRNRQRNDVLLPLCSLI